jgi:hypothetical protein
MLSNILGLEPGAKLFSPFGFGTGPFGPNDGRSTHSDPKIGYALANPVEIAFSVSSKTVTSSGGQLNQTSSLNNFPARGETFAQTV